MSQEPTHTTIVDGRFEERWAAWQARGAANDRATRRKLFVLAAILGAAVPMMLLVQSQRHENALQRRAVRVADNLLERVLAVDWAELDAGLAGESIGAAELLDAIPGGTWNLSVIEEHTPVAAKRVTVAVSYRSRGRTGNVHVTSWTFDNPVGQASQPVTHNPIGLRTAHDAAKQTSNAHATE